jgi:hypothetical protein
MTKLSYVVLVDTWSTIREVAACLEAQTVAREIELVLVCHRRDALGLPDEPVARLARVTVVEHPLVPLAAARAAGIRAAVGEVVVFGETHVFPGETWAERLVAAHALAWDAVTPEIGNANPSTLTWAALLLDYGRFATGIRGEIAGIPRHNVSIRRSALLDYGERLESMLEPVSDLGLDFRARGLRLYHEADAQLEHLNVRRLWPWLVERYLCGRLVGGTRSLTWSMPRRLAYAIGSPLIPVVVVGRVVRLPGRAGERARRLLPALVFGAVVQAVGEAIAYVTGGLRRSEERMLEYELHKPRYAGWRAA